MEIKHFESDNKNFVEDFKDTIEGFDPPVVPKIVRSYKTNTGCIINHSCVLLLGQDFTKLTIAHKDRPISFDEESYFYPFISGDIKSYCIARNKEFEGGFITSISNQEELMEQWEENVEEDT
jgi:hypothetical protein